MRFRHLNPFELLKAATLALLAALLFSLGSASHPTSWAAYLAFSAIMALQAFEMFAPGCSPAMKEFLRRISTLRLSILAQLILASILVAVTDGSGSIYELVYLLPIISAAMKLSGRDVVLVVAGAILAIVGFILTGEQLTPGITHVKEFQDAVAAIVYFTMAGLLVYFFAREERDQRERYQALAAALGERNEELRHAQVQLSERLAQVTKMEERLQQVSRMAVLGEMAGQVAHEVRNPLGIIKGAVDMLAGRVTDPAVQRYLTVVREEADRLNKAVEGVLRLGTPMRIRRAPVELSQLLRSVVEVSKAWPLPNHIDVRLIEVCPPVRIEGDYDLLHQALGNLLRNACQAMPAGGVVTIRCEPCGDGLVEVRIIDEGIGMADEDLRRLGDPFFTKRQSGIGLGFSLARRVVSEHGGSLRVASALGQGTTVIIALPVMDGRSVPTYSASARERSL